jgi:hypothetical protein
MILADKYVYHDPHYRQSARFLHRFGAELSRQTLNTWTHAAVRHLEPLRAAITNELRLAEVIQIDETPMFYLSPGLKANRPRLHVVLSRSIDRDSGV